MAATPPTDSEKPRGPAYLDTTSCRCSLQAPNVEDGGTDGQEEAWRCQGDYDEPMYQGTAGKWFRTQGPGDLADLAQPQYWAENPPQLSQPLRILKRKFVDFDDAAPGDVNPQNAACTGKNDTTQSAAYYRSTTDPKGFLQGDDRPCLFPGGVPVTIVNASLWQEEGCALGFLCENNNIVRLPQMCPPVPDCQLARLVGGACHPSMGLLEPQICQEGKFCPDGGQSTQDCPAGYFCPIGTYDPIPCSVGSFCPVGSDRDLTFLPLALLVVLEIVMVSLTVTWRLRLKYGKGKRENPYRRALGLIGLGKRAHGKEYRVLDEVDMPVLEGRIQNLKRADTFLAPMDEQFIYSGYGESDADAKVSDINQFLSYLSKETSGGFSGLSFEFSDLAFQPKKASKPILSEVTGSIRQGSLVGVMGGSGAGKTTFVSVLMGKQKNTGGITKINGVQGNISAYRKVVGYVPQDDIVLPELTVRENILHSARIRLPCTWTDKEIQKYTDIVISCLQLSHVADSLVGSPAAPVISGGQRKRVSIGLELAAAPMALFLDEPTSGLDATSASSIMAILKALSRLGITVVTIIHQPRQEIFEKLDSLLLFGNGRSIFQGPVTNVQTYFENIGFRFPEHGNPADTVMDIITGEGALYKKSGDTSINGLIEHWKNHYQSSGFGPRSRSNSSPTIEPGTDYRSELSNIEMSGVGTQSLITSLRAPEPTAFGISPGPSRSASPNPYIDHRSVSPVSRGRSRSVSPHPLRGHIRGHSRSISNVTNASSRTASPERPHHHTFRLRRSSDPDLEKRVADIKALHRSIRTRGAYWYKQIYLCLCRALLQQARFISSFYFELGVSSLAGFLIGLAETSQRGANFRGYFHGPYALLSSSIDYFSVPQMSLLVGLAIGLTASSPGVKVFGEEKLVYYREAAAGHNRLAYYLGKILSTLPRMVLANLHFTVLWMLLSTPRIYFGPAFAANLLYFYCIYGLASCISMLARREDGPLLATMISLIVGVINGMSPTLHDVTGWRMIWLWRASPGTWLSEAYFDQNVTPWAYLYDIGNAEMAIGYRLGWFGFDLLMLLALGTAYRILAFIGLRFLNRHRQR